MSHFNWAIRMFQTFRGSEVSTKKTEELYKKASAVVDSISEQRWQEAVNKLFKPQATNTYFENLERIQQAVARKKAPKEVQQAVENIRAKAGTYVAECEEGALSGKVREAHTYTEEVRKDYETIYDYAMKKAESNLGNAEIFDEYLSMAKKVSDLKYNSPFEARIGKLKDGVLPKDGMLYHGTTQPRTILRNGFSEMKSNQVSKAPREFGAGVYLTPDKKVASHFAGIIGRIMHVKADVKNTAMINSPQYSGLSGEVSSLLSTTGYETGNVEGNIVAELLIKKLFNKAGYDSVYASQGMTSGLFAKNADEWLGRAQSQLVVFDGAKVSSVGQKTLTQKIKDELLQIGTRFKVIFNTHKMLYKDPIGCILGM